MGYGGELELGESIESQKRDKRNKKEKNCVIEQSSTILCH